MKDVENRARRWLSLHMEYNGPWPRMVKKVMIEVLTFSSIEIFFRLLMYSWEDVERSRSLFTYETQDKRHESESSKESTNDNGAEVITGARFVVLWPWAVFNFPLETSIDLTSRPKKSIKITHRLIKPQKWDSYLQQRLPTIVIQQLRHVAQVLVRIEASEGYNSQENETIWVW
jgi:hypothetical protein